jgi:hypothetical protein
MASRSSSSFFSFPLPPVPALEEDAGPVFFALLSSFLDVFFSWARRLAALACAFASALLAEAFLLDLVSSEVEKLQGQKGALRGTGRKG